MAAPDLVDVRRLRRSAFVAGMGDGVVAVALPLIAAGLTRDPLAVAGVVVAQHLPWPLLALAMPALTTVDRRTLTGSGDSARAVAVAVAGLLTIIGNETILTIQLVAFVVGVAQALRHEAERVGGETGRDRAGDPASAAVSGAGMVGLAVLGFPLGGVLYELLAGIPLLFDVGVFAVAALLALAVRRPLLDPVNDQATRQVVPHLAKGTGLLTAAATIATLAAGAVAGVLVLLALDDLGLGAPAFGLLLAGLAASSTVGAIAAPTAGRAIGLRTATVLALVLASGAAAGARALLDPEVPLLAVAALGLGAAAGMAAGVLLLVARHGGAGARAGEADRRALHLLLWGATPSGALVGGLVGGAGRPADVLVVGALGTLLAAALTLVAPSTGPATAS